MFPRAGAYRIEVIARVAGVDRPARTVRYTQLADGDAAYLRGSIRETFRPVFLELVTGAEALEPGRSYLRRW